MRVYSWNEWNVAHIAQHDVRPREAEYVIAHANHSFPASIGQGKWMVRGKTRSGRWLQVIFVYPDDSEIDPDSLTISDLIAFSEGDVQAVYVIHARELTDNEKRAARKIGPQ